MPVMQQRELIPDKTLEIKDVRSIFIAAGPDKPGAGDYSFSAGISDRILKF